MSKRIISLEFSVNSVFKQKSAFEKIGGKKKWKFLLLPILWMMFGGSVVRVFNIKLKNWCRAFAYVWFIYTIWIYEHIHSHNTIVTPYKTWREHISFIFHLKSKLTLTMMANSCFQLYIKSLQGVLECYAKVIQGLLYTCRICHPFKT